MTPPPDLFAEPAQDAGSAGAPSGRRLGDGGRGARVAMAEPEGDRADRAAGAGPEGDRADRAASAGPRSPSRARPPRPATGDRRVRGVAAAILIAALLAPAAWSYGATLAQPGNTPLGVRSVDWLRDHKGRWLVNDVENFWYSHHKPKKGGAPTQPLVISPTATAPTSPTSAAHAATTVPAGPAHLPAPATVVPIVTPALPHEGEWQPLGQLVSGIPAMYATEVRPDPVYTSVVTGVVWMDTKLTKAVLYAGVEEPGGSGWRYQAPVALADRPDLLAAFNSGFRLNDSQGGYFAEGKTVRALKDGGATLMIDANGTPTVGVLGRDFQMGPNVAFARQNLSLIVDNGAPAPDLATSNYKWGATVGNKVLVWRSGVGVTASGALVYAGGNDLSASTLARVLVQAGAVRAMELDINSWWVSFFTYGPAAAGQPAGDLTITKLLPEMQAPANRYLSANSRDFFGIFRRTP